MTMNLAAICPRVRVSRNQRDGMWTVRDAKTKQVIGTTTELMLSNIRFHVNTNKRDRIRAHPYLESNETHSWIEGDLVSHADVLDWLHLDLEELLDPTRTGFNPSWLEKQREVIDDRRALASEGIAILGSFYHQYSVNATFSEIISRVETVTIRMSSRPEPETVLVDYPLCEISYEPRYTNGYTAISYYVSRGGQLSFSRDMVRLRAIREQNGQSMADADDSEVLATCDRAFLNTDGSLITHRKYADAIVQPLPE